MLRIADKTFESHLFTGTGKFAAPEVMVEAIRASGSQLVTLAMKRVDLRQNNDAILAPLLAAGVNLLPNTSGAKTAEEAVFAARLAREALGTHWLKLEIHPDARWLLPDPIETLKAAELLVREPGLCWRLLSNRRRYRWWLMPGSACRAMRRRRWRWAQMRCWSIPPLPSPTTP